MGVLHSFFWFWFFWFWFFFLSSSSRWLPSFFYLAESNASFFVIGQGAMGSVEGMQ